jgi:DNA replication licensing factor MCM2
VPLEQLSDIKAKSIVEWIAIDRVRRSIVKHFRQFLMTYVDDHGASVYGQRIRNLGESTSFLPLIKHITLTTPIDNSESLEVSYLHLALSKPILAYFLTNSPAVMLTIFDEVALAAILVYYPSYERIHSEVHVRITDLPLSSSLRDLRTSNLNNLVRVSGVVTRRTGVFPQLKYVKFDCRKCGAVLGPFYQDATKEVRISYCANCESKGPFSVNSEQVSQLPVPLSFFLPPDSC